MNEFEAIYKDVLQVHRKIQRKENKKPQMGNRAPITVFIPVYNEEAILKANIETLARYLETHWPDYEILIASNGSTDRTVAISKELHESNLRVNFFHLSAKGVGLAFEEGIRKAAWDRIITVDADLTTDMNFIPRAARLLDEYEIVVGSKKNGSQKRSLVRLAGSGSFIFCVRLLLKLPYVDYSIGSKAYRRSTIARYTRHINYGSSYVIEIIYRAWRHGSRITEIPVYCEDTRESKFNLAHEGIYRFSNLFKLWLTR